MVFLYYEAMEHMLYVSSYSDHFPPKTEKYTQKAVWQIWSGQQNIV